MVRREFFDAIERGEKTWEFRKDTKRWRSVFDAAPQEAVFMCGRRLMRRAIVGRVLFAHARYALGRPPTAEELEMLGRGIVLGFEIGAELPVEQTILTDGPLQMIA